MKTWLLNTPLTLNPLTKSTFEQETQYVLVAEDTVLLLSGATLCDTADARRLLTVIEISSFVHLSHFHFYLLMEHWIHLVLVLTIQGYFWFSFSLTFVLKNWSSRRQFHVWTHTQSKRQKKLNYLFVDRCNLHRIAQQLSLYIFSPQIMNTLTVWMEMNGCRQQTEQKMNHREYWGENGRCGTLWVCGNKDVRERWIDFIWWANGNTKFWGEKRLRRNNLSAAPWEQGILQIISLLSLLSVRGWRSCIGPVHRKKNNPKKSLCSTWNERQRTEVTTRWSISCFVHR